MSRARLVVFAACLVVLAPGRHPNEAHADSRPATSTIYVGEGGLVFRDQQGRAIARLSSDSGGGVWELLDTKEQATLRFRASQAAPLPPPPAPPPAATLLVRPPRILDDADPWMDRPPKKDPGY
jgi:hypothetical protein